jgi:5-bromo-4-chloroindolyl phosphate hydrolysis protein
VLQRTSLLFFILTSIDVTTNIIVRTATAADIHYAETITTEMAESAKARGTGIAKRSPDYIQQKMEEGKAVIALTPEGTWVTRIP